ncbi:MAG: PspC domain-containing protein [Chitinophagaceae bacterium]
MKKVISINFQGRVLPIEESAYEQLKEYIDSLRTYFATEEGKDEIINDIEGRLAELFFDRLKNGNNCITEATVHEVISSIGRPSDLEAAELNPGRAERPSSSGASTSGTERRRGRLFRNADDKILGGVASGLASYLQIDPVIMRILFVVIGGPLFWVYLLLWIIVPSQSLTTHITKRFYRSGDEKVIAGVCGGLAAYFNIEVWIPRLVFALPFVLRLISGSFDFWADENVWFGPRLIFGSIGSTFFLSYLILWIAVPKATSATQKLEMKGERVDLNTIRDTIQEDLGNVRQKAKAFGSELKEVTQDLGERAQHFGKKEATPVIKTLFGGLWQVIKFFIKAFLVLLGGVLAFSLFVLLFAMLIGGTVIFPYLNFFIEGIWQYLGVIGVGLVIVIPFLAFLTWMIRRLIGARSQRHYLGYVFGSLFLIGVILVGLLISSVAMDFREQSGREISIPLKQPSKGKLYVEGETIYHESDPQWLFKWDVEDPIPFSRVDLDTLLLRSVTLRTTKSRDDSFHLSQLKVSLGRTKAEAKESAEKIQYTLVAADSLLILPEGFLLSAPQQFRYQQVRLLLEVPVGMKIQFRGAVRKKAWFSIRVADNGIIGQGEESGEAYWDSDVEYIMTPDQGLIRVDQLDPGALKNGKLQQWRPQSSRNESPSITQRRHLPSFQSQRPSHTDQTIPETRPRPAGDPSPDSESTLISPVQEAVYVFGRFFMQ